FLVKRASLVAVCTVGVPFFYPSVGVRLAQVGCFERVRTAPSSDEPKAQRQHERVLTARDHDSFPSKILGVLLRRPGRPPASDGTANAPSDWPPPLPPGSRACRPGASAAPTPANAGRAAPAGAPPRSAPPAAADWPPGSSPRPLAAARWRRSS